VNLEVLRNWGNRVVCLFQPHNYSRTRYFLQEFAESFANADIVMLLPIYTSREQDTGDVSSLQLLERIRAVHPNALYAEDFDDAVRQLTALLTDGDLLLTMGAGDVYLVGERLLRT
jgi:UDP-N-acetylmuramate--alanine ligase